MPAALVFGARNLGRAVAAHLRASGFEVAVAARSEDSLARVKSELSGVLTLQADARDEADVDRTFASSAKAFGQIDLVVTAISPSTAGGHRSGSLAELPASALEAYSHDLLPALFHSVNGGQSSDARAGRRHLHPGHRWLVPSRHAAHLPMGRPAPPARGA